MFNKLKAWWEILKFVKSLTKVREAQLFYKGNVIKVLEKEGLFEFLKEPKSTVEIIERFKYTDFDLLSVALNLLRKDKILELTNDLKFKAKPENIGTYPSSSRLLSEALKEIMLNYIEGFPDRLRGIYADFTAGFNLFNWDDALTDALYEKFRRAAFIYSGALKKEGSFLEIGCGTGYSTAAIFNYYIQKNLIYPGTQMQIVGIEPDEGLLEIASNEFSMLLLKHSKNTISDVSIYSEYYPNFKKGYVENLPFEDNSMDFIYCAQVLHWTNPQRAISEMMRVIKPGGYVFGIQSVSPRVNQYVNFHIISVKGAHGFFTRKELINWAKEAGARKVKTAYPLIAVCFKFVK